MSGFIKFYFANLLPFFLLLFWFYNFLHLSINLKCLHIIACSCSLLKTLKKYIKRNFKSRFVIISWLLWWIKMKCSAKYSFLLLRVEIPFIFLSSHSVYYVMPKLNFLKHFWRIKRFLNWEEYFSSIYGFKWIFKLIWIFLEKTALNKTFM